MSNKQTVKRPHAKAQKRLTKRHNASMRKQNKLKYYRCKAKAKCEKARLHQHDIDRKLVILNGWFDKWW